MPSTLLDNFRRSLDKVRPTQRLKILRSVYRQLIDGTEAEKNYRAMLSNMGQDNVAEFLSRVADELYKHGCNGRADRLLSRSGLVKTFERWKDTEYQLGKIHPDYPIHATLYVVTGGIQLDEGGFRAASPNSSCITLRDGSCGSGTIPERYELWPRFNGRGLGYFGYRHDFLAPIDLETALSISHTILEGDLKRFKAAAGLK